MTALTESALRALILDVMQSTQAMQSELAAETALDTKMVSDAIATTLLPSSMLAEIDGGLLSLSAMAQQESAAILAAFSTSKLERKTVPSVGIALAGNVFTAAWRPLLLALLSGARVSFRVSNRQRLFAETLTRVCVTHSLEVECESFARDDEKAWASWMQRAGLVHAYGGDETMRELSQLADQYADAFVAHGSGFAVSVVSDPNSFTEADALAAAWDVLMYEGQGCLSPRKFYIVGDSSCEERIGAMLLSAMHQVALHYPLPTARTYDVSRAQAELLATYDHAFVLGADAKQRVGIVHTDTEVALPPRTMVVTRIDKESDVVGMLQSYGARLKGLYSDSSILRDTYRMRAHVAAWGKGQRPPMNAWLDGMDPFRFAMR